MIEIVNGDILECKENVICQQVNCQNTMKSGLAKSIMEKYPCVKESYHNFCDRVSPDRLLGEVNIVSIGKNKYVCNLFGQYDYGKDKSNVYTNYFALGAAFIRVRRIFLISENSSLAIPNRIGCGQANGDWSIVYKNLSEIFADYLDRVKIYKKD